MKFLTFIRRRGLPALAALASILTTARPSCAQETPEATPSSDSTPASTPDKPKSVAAGNEVAMYSPFESPWAEIRTNHAFETHLFNLLRAEVRLWALQNQLAAQEGPAREEADGISRILHAQVLAQAAEALPLLQKTPNRPFALLLVHELEAYPYEWKEEGSEELLPSLHKLVDVPAANPTPAPKRRRRQRSNDDDAIPTAPAVPKPTGRDSSPSRP